MGRRPRQAPVLVSGAVLGPDRGQRMEEAQVRKPGVLSRMVQPSQHRARIEQREGRERASEDGAEEDLADRARGQVGRPAGLPQLARWLVAQTGRIAMRFAVVARGGGAG